MKTIGLVVNPVAGMGGSVGLKGTDGGMHEKALTLGARPVSPALVHEFLTHLHCRESVRLLAAPGPMGVDHAQKAGMICECIGQLGSTTGPDDTRRIARQMADAGIDALVFAGGDGTARDVADAIGLEIPVIGIPAGVKIYSSVFAYSARAAAALLDALLAGAGVTEQEVLDIDEAAFREGRVDSQHYGYLLVPDAGQFVQAGKDSSGSGASPEVMDELGRAIADDMEPGVLYLLGSGTTVRYVADALGLDKTLLGVDAVVDATLVGTDLNEQKILALLDRYDHAVIVVTPLGGNGFILGRGNKQFTPAVLKRVGRDNITVIANREKLLELDALHVDTGDPAVDGTLTGYMDVVVGPGHRKMMRVR
jgi:predicted polyphosphate/ATP-dependent NAD kinase